MKSPKDFTEAYAHAVRHAKIDEFVDLYDEDVRIFDIWDDWSLSGRESCRAMAREWFSSLGSEHVVVTFSDVQIVESQELASLTCFVRFAGHDSSGKQLRFLDERMTVTLRRRGLVWKVTHQHTSAPIDSQKMSAKMVRT